VRLARFAVEGGHQVFAARDGGWVPLPGVQGMLMTDLVAEPHRTRIADQVGAAQVGAAQVGGPTLENAATVLDSGDIWGAGLNYRGHSAGRAPTCDREVVSSTTVGRSRSRPRASA
jgi:hypothetical protein